MEEKDFKKYLDNRYVTQIDWYDSNATWNQRVYKAIQWSVIVLSAVVPVLIAIGIGWQRWLAVVIAALVSIGTSGLKAFKYQENWINYRTTCETLRKEIYYYKARANNYRNSDDPEALFVERVEALISRENTFWLRSQEHKGE